MIVYKQSCDLPWSHDHVGIDMHNNGRMSFTERSFAIKTMNFLVIRHPRLVVLVAYKQNIYLVEMAVLNVGDNTLEHILHSLYKRLSPIAVMAIFS